MDNVLNPFEPAIDFETFILDIIEDGGKKKYGFPHSVIPLFRKDESAGFVHFEGLHLIRKIEIRRVSLGRIEAEWTEYGDGPYSIRRTFLAGGNPVGTTRILGHHSLFPRLENSCPVIDLLYRIAYAEFQRIPEGQANLELLQLVERLIGEISRKRPEILSFAGGSDSMAWRLLQDELDRLAASPVHTWKERLTLSRRWKQEYRSVVRFKRRIHRSVLGDLCIKETFDSAFRSLRRFAFRPRKNLLGLLDHLLLDPLRWFSGVVRSNMGYSIALAVYSPFTFFFITQPMNPHAMWAVEKVRNAGLGLIDTAKENPGKKHESSLQPIPTGADSTGWAKRMEHFKSMQIALESNLEFSQRIGRLEEVETQLGWPLALQGAWDESTRYLESLTYLTGSGIDTDLKSLVLSEQRRIQEIRLYLVDRLMRFILDHRYMVLDPDGELNGSGPSARMALHLYSKVTDAFLQDSPPLKLPPEAATILEISRKSRLPLGAQTSPSRDRKKRYWESLYLMQSRNQESSNAGLQAYWWSVRNTVSALQSILATRREELVLLSIHPRPTLAARSRFEDRYRSQLHLMETEYESLRPELRTSISGDQEASNRESLLAGIRSFLTEREKLR